MLEGHWIWNPRKGDGTVKLDSVDNVVGIYLEDGSVKCRDCMDDEDWENLRQDRTITEEDLVKGDEWIYCDYCEKRLS
jgi:hypothetical protein